MAAGDRLRIRKNFFDKVAASIARLSNFAPLAEIGSKGISGSLMPHEGCASAFSLAAHFFGGVASAFVMPAKPAFTFSISRIVPALTNFGVAIMLINL